MAIRGGSRGAADGAGSRSNTVVHPNFGMSTNNEQPAPQPASSPQSAAAGLLLLFLALAAILGAIGFRVWDTAERFVTNSSLVAHSYEVEAQVSAVLARIGTLQADAAGYGATGDELRLSRFKGQLPLLESDMKVLSELVSDNSTQVERVNAFIAGVRQLRDEAVTVVDGRSAFNRTPPLPDLGVNAVRGLSRAVLDEEDNLLHQRRVDTEHTLTMTQMLTSIAILLSLIFLAGAYALVVVTLRRNTRSNVDLRETNAQLGVALNETRRIGESMHKLSQLGEMLQSCREVEEVRAGLGGVMGDLLPDFGGRLALINPTQNLAAIGAHWGQHAMLAESVFPPEDCWALRRHQAYPLAGTSAGFICRHLDRETAQQAGASYLCVPLAAQGEVVGVLTLDGARALTPGERRITLAAGEQIALALANLRLQESLRTQSIRDPLTGLFNRRYLEVSLERELMRAARRSLPLAVLMLDIDHFKRFNDSYGHDAGDALLEKFADVLKRSIRNEDIACRYGGEEFTVVVLEADASGIMQRAEQIRVAVAALAFEHRGEPMPRVTVSIGAAVFPRDGRTADAILRSADMALYRAKGAGRDCVVLSEESAVA